MDEMPSSEFRRRYATLTQPTIVTVLGRPIGHYVPISTAMDARAMDGLRPGEPASDYLFEASNALKRSDPIRFNSQSFTGPIPKVRK